SVRVAAKVVDKGRRYAVARHWLGKGLPTYTCPLCDFHGGFVSTIGVSAKRVAAVCPNCRSFERHRLQKVVLDRLNGGAVQFAGKSCLQFSRDSISPFLSTICKHVMVVDNSQMSDDTLRMDMREIPLADETFDIVFASHVLEHIKDDMTALKEVRRVLKPGGIAILPVPISLTEPTVEFASPQEFGHVRAPGFDYFDRYTEVFGKTDLFLSNQ